MQRPNESFNAFNFASLSHRKFVSERSTGIWGTQMCEENWAQEMLRLERIESCFEAFFVKL